MSEKENVVNVGEIDLSIKEEQEPSYLEKALYNHDGVALTVRVGRLASSLLAIFLAIYVIYSAGFGGLPAWQHRGIFTSIFLVLCYSWVPFKKGRASIHWLFDGVPLLLSILVTIFIYQAYPEIALREGNPTTFDMVVGTIMIFLVIEGVRRTVGWAMAILAFIFWAYIFVGPWIPGLMGHPGFTYDKMIDNLFITTLGIFTAPIYVASTVLILFLLFCSLLLKSGAGRFFIEFAFALTGRKRGGPALAAVVSSGLMATITGNGAANATMTGSFTIPLMKKVGYRPEFAGAVEAVASQGGQIMPPIMGASAFIMAEYTGIPYIKIAAYATIPAILYFLVAGLVIYFQAGKRGLQGIPKEQLPDFWHVMRDRGYLMLPLILIVVLMVKGYSPMMAGLWALILVYVLSFIKKETRMNFVQLMAALENGVRTSMATVMACAGAGIITGAVLLTGLGIRFSRVAVDLSGGHLLPMLFLIMVASMILGMGMPTVSAYVVLATVAVGGLTNIDVPVMAAHLFVFYFGIVSGITPPVAITSYITSGIAGANPMKTSLEAVRIGLAGFLLPYMFVYNPTLILQGDLGQIVLGVVTTALGLTAFAAGIQGFFIRAVPNWQRLLLLISAISLVNPGPITDLVGFGLMAAVLFLQLRLSRSEENVGVLLKQ